MKEDEILLVVNRKVGNRKNSEEMKQMRSSEYYKLLVREYDN